MPRKKAEYDSKIGETRGDSESNPFSRRVKASRLAGHVLKSVSSVLVVQPLRAPRAPLEYWTPTTAHRIIYSHVFMDLLNVDNYTS